MAERSIGGLWTRKDRNGNKYLSGVIEINDQKHQIVVFHNTRKQEGEKTPDARIYLQQNREDDGRPAAQQDDDDSAPF